VEPRTLEAKIVALADEAAMAGLLWESAGELEL
jgi:hypothetical protein